MTWTDQLAEMAGGGRNVTLSYDSVCGYACDVYEAQGGAAAWLAGPAFSPTFEESIAYAYATFQRTMRTFNPHSVTVMRWDRAIEEAERGE